MANDDLTSDVTMATLAGGSQAIQAELSAMRSRETTMRAEISALQSQDGIQNLSLDERGRERTYRPFQGALRPQNTKVQYFSNLPGENFLAWCSQFQVIADYHRWSDEEAKQLMYAYIKGTMLESIMDIQSPDQSRPRRPWTSISGGSSLKVTPNCCGLNSPAWFSSPTSRSRNCTPG